jgi:hypothetical protein
MRDPFRRLLPRDERLRAAGEVDLAIRRGPLALPAEMLALCSPIISVVLFIRLDGPLAKALGVVLPPVVTILLAVFVLRTWRRAREWVGVTDRRVLVWRRPAALIGGATIQAFRLEDIQGVELVQDAWDRRAGTHQLILRLRDGDRDLGRLRAGEALRDAIVQAAPHLAPAREGPPQPRTAFVPPAPTTDYRP